MRIRFTIFNHISLIPKFYQERNLYRQTLGHNDLELLSFSVRV